MGPGGAASLGRGGTDDMPGAGWDATQVQTEIWCVLLSEINQKVEKDIQAPGGFSVTGKL